MKLHRTIATISCGMAAPLSLALALGPSLVSCGPSARDGGNAPFRLPRANLIMVSIDTLRADRLGAYGYDRDTSPSIDALAARGVRFETVVAASSWTAPSHMTLMTGLHPTTHGVTERRKLPDGITTLAQVLRENGYTTYANTAGAFLSRRFAFDRGFEVFDQSKAAFQDTLKRFGVTLFSARKRLERFPTDQPFFFFLHTYDVHCPYKAPREYAQMFRTRPRKDHLDVSTCKGEWRRNAAAYTPGQLRFLSDQYDAGIRDVDAALGEFVDFLDESGLLDTTLLIVLSDHGEEFAEHGRVDHAWTLHIESLKVPLIFVAPGLEPRVVRQGVGLVDVMPTVLEILDIPAPPVEGRSLVPLLMGRASDDFDRPLFSELDFRGRLRSVVHGDEHLIRDLKTETSQWFDWSEDPTEQRGREPSDSNGGARLEQVLSEHLAGLKPSQPVPAGEISPQEREQLRALGYLD